MAIPSIMNTGNSGLVAAKTAIATTGHNITNANTEGFSRQRVITEAADAAGGRFSNVGVGMGTHVTRVERINDEYIEKQLRNSQKEFSHFEEKDLLLKQVEDVFNEMNGDGLNRLVSKFFNEFRKLSQEPESPAFRESLREASQAMVNDFHRLRSEVDEVRKHIDAKIEGYTKEVNSLSGQIAELNGQIRQEEVKGHSPNDLLDKRDLALKRLSSFLDVAMHKDNNDHYNVDIRGVGPLVTSVFHETLSAERTPADDQGKPEQAYDLISTGTARGTITHQIKGGKLGALVETRDRTLSTILSRLDEMAYSLTTAVNDVHVQGFTLNGMQGVRFFNPLEERDRAAEFISLSDEVRSSANNIATAVEPDSPGDNRIAIGIARLQNEKFLGDGSSTADEWYNSIVSDVGVASSRNRFSLNQQKDIMTQLNKVREQISGVSIDEETANLLQFQHVFDASAKVIQIADEMFKTVLALKRD